MKRPEEAIEWLSDQEGIFTEVLDFITHLEAENEQLRVQLTNDIANWEMRCEELEAENKQLKRLWQAVLNNEFSPEINYEKAVADAERLTGKNIVLQKRIRELVRQRDATERSRDDNYDKWQADKKRLDRFLYLNICMNDEGWHPRNRDEFDTVLENVEAGREEERRLQREVEEEPDHE